MQKVRTVKCALCAKDISPKVWEDGIISYNLDHYEVSGLDMCGDCAEAIFELQDAVKELDY